MNQFDYETPSMKPFFKSLAADAAAVILLITVLTVTFFHLPELAQFVRG